MWILKDNKKEEDNDYYDNHPFDDEIFNTKKEAIKFAEKTYGFSIEKIKATNIKQEV